MPAIGVVLVDRDDAAMLLAELTAGLRHGDGELGEAIAAIALNMDLEQLDRMAAGARRESFGVIGGRKRVTAANDRATAGETSTPSVA